MAIVDDLVSILTGTSAYNAELRTLGMAFQGAMTVREGPNKDKSMNWFHAYCLLTVVAFGGGWFGFLWMGKPTSLITGGDVTLTICIFCFVLTTYTPFYKLGNFLPFKVLYVFWAQLFRAMGMIAFIDTCNAEVSASKYYPSPVLGPVLYGTLLGNVGSFFLKGFNGHLEKDIPWAFQNGIVMGLFYQLYANDKDGLLGKTLRSFVKSTGLHGEFDDKTFAVLVVSTFMQITGILMIPEFLGPSWSPIMGPMKYVATIYDAAVAPPTTMDTPTTKVVVHGNNSTNPIDRVSKDELDEQITFAGKKKRKNKKKKA